MFRVPPIMDSMAPTCGSLRAGAMVDGDGTAGHVALTDSAHDAVEGPWTTALAPYHPTVLFTPHVTTDAPVVARALSPLLHIAPSHAPPPHTHRSVTPA